jgi:hypothetical protein
VVYFYEESQKKKKKKKKVSFADVKHVKRWHPGTFIGVASGTPDWYNLMPINCIMYRKTSGNIKTTFGGLSWLFYRAFLLLHRHFNHVGTTV